MALQNLYIEAGHNTPEVSFDSSTGDLILKGKSIPENATQVYAPLIEWIVEYVKKPQEETNLHLDMIYFNTASSIWIAKMFKELSSINDNERLLIIHLYFHIEEFDEMEEQDLADAISPITDILKTAGVSIGVKVYGKADSGALVKERLILL
jgi:hypothetical protein